jgi:hypothetical protein
MDAKMSDSGSCEDCSTVHDDDDHLASPPPSPVALANDNHVESGNVLGCDGGCKSDIGVYEPALMDTLAHTKESPASDPVDDFYNSDDDTPKCHNDYYESDDGTSDEDISLFGTLGPISGKHGTQVRVLPADGSQEVSQINQNDTDDADTVVMEVVHADFDERCRQTVSPNNSHGLNSSTANGCEARTETFSQGEPTISSLDVPFESRLQHDALIEQLIGALGAQSSESSSDTGSCYQGEEDVDDLM